MTEPLSAKELAVRIDAVDYNIYRPWHETDATPLIFSYRFEEQASEDFPWTDVSGFAPWSAPQRETIETALSAFETIINVDFVERTNAADPDFSFFRASEGLFGGRGRFYWSERDGDATWDGWAAFNTNRAMDEGDLWLALHEIGHTLGLKHTGDYDVGGNLPPGPFLSEAEDNTRFSIMSYTEDPTLGRVNALGLYDVAALQTRFGANMNHATGRDTYSGPADQVLETIWDAGGIDTLSAKGLSVATHLDLRAGTFSDFGFAGEMAIAYGVVVENAVGGIAADIMVGNSANNRMSGGDGNDTITAGSGRDVLLGQGGNDLLSGGRGKDKLKGGSGNDDMKGNGGADRFLYDLGNDRIVGGSGKDTYVARSDRDNFELAEVSDGVWTLTRGLETDTLIGIERIVFTDDILQI